MSKSIEDAMKKFEKPVENYIPNSNMRNWFLSNIRSTLTSLVQKEVKQIKEERDIYCQELELGVSVDCQKHCEKEREELTEILEEKIKSYPEFDFEAHHADVVEFERGKSWGRLEQLEELLSSLSKTP